MILVAHQVKDEPLAGGEANLEPPLLRAHLVPVDREAGALRLGDLHWLQILPGPIGEMRDVSGVADSCGGVVAAAWRQGDHPVVLDFHYFHPVEVEADDQALHRTGVAVVVGDFLRTQVSGRRNRPCPAASSGPL